MDAHRFAESKPLGYQEIPWPAAAFQILYAKDPNLDIQGDGKFGAANGRVRFIGNSARALFFTSHLAPTAEWNGQD